MKRLCIILAFCPTLLFAQNKSVIYGNVTAGGKGLAFANISVKYGSSGTISLEDGSYQMELASGEYDIVASYIGYEKEVKHIHLKSGEKLRLDFKLNPQSEKLKEVVVSGKNTNDIESNNLLVVDKMNQQKIRQTQSMNLAEAVNYMPAVRIENNCQNCGFTQLRINGLPGSYSQILINNRPIFSAMTSIYGLEQIPTAMINSIEVVRNGGNSLHGANAIGGTVNIITKEPQYNSWSVESNTAAIDRQTLDQTINFHAALVDDEQKSGIQFFGSQRDKSDYDANGDGFSELPLIENNSWGANAFYRLNKANKISLDFSSIEESRRGGDRLQLPPHYTDITEEIQTQNTLASINHDWKTANHEISTYLSFRQSKRESYYGGLGGGRTASDSSLATKAYGNTSDYSLVAGSKWLYRFHEKAQLINGIELQNNSVEDEFPAFQRSIKQEVINPAVFSQLRWDIFKHSKLSFALRLDHIDLNGDYQLLDEQFESKKSWTTVNPRLAFLQELSHYWNIRLSYASGFRPPQTFNEDMHISTAAGETVFTLLSEELQAENSHAYNAEISYEKALKPFDFQFQVEAFYTSVNHTFTTVNSGSTASGIIVNHLVNGAATEVYGNNIKLRLKQDYKWDFEVGSTLQEAIYEEEQLIFESEEGSVQEDRILRSPNIHAYFFFNQYLKPDIQFSLNGKYTGSMIVPRLIESGEAMELTKSPDFFELNFKLSKDIYLSGQFQMQISAGVQNLLNSYQNDFSSGPERDSDYVYGPLRPRTFLLSVKLGSFK